VNALHLPECGPAASVDSTGSMLAPMVFDITGALVESSSYPTPLCVTSSSCDNGSKVAFRRRCLSTWRLHGL
jgi:hypothetical protein